MDQTDLEIYQKFVEDNSSKMVMGTGQLEILWASSGLAAEAGEVSGVCEKALRKSGVILPEHEDKLFDELGDVLFFLTAVCNAIDVSLDRVMEYNMSKINQRQEEGYYATSA